MGLSRRFLNLIVYRRIPGSRSLSCIDLTQHDFFNTTPTRLPQPRGASPWPPNADAGVKKMMMKRAPEAAWKMEMVQLPSPIFNFQAAASTKIYDRWSIDCFPLAGRELLCADQTGRTFLFDLDTRLVVTMPDLRMLKRSPVSLFIPNADMDGDNCGNLFVMDGSPKEEGTWCKGPCSDQFEVFAYRKNTMTVSRQSLPPPPFVRDPKYWHGRPKISSYTVLGGGSEICISVKGVGTYCFDTVKHTWRDVGDWTLPFQGKVEYVPELKLWFGLSAETEHCAVADLSSMDSQPQLLQTWMELAPLKEWRKTRHPQFVSLGSGKFCIARYMHTQTLGGFYGDYIYEHHFTALTGVEVEPCAHEGNSRGRGIGYANANGADQAELQMSKFETKLYVSKDGNLIKSVF